MQDPRSTGPGPNPPLSLEDDLVSTRGTAELLEGNGTGSRWRIRCRCCETEMVFDTRLPALPRCPCGYHWEVQIRALGQKRELQAGS